jgi:hypothetical protein
MFNFLKSILIFALLFVPAIVYGQSSPDNDVLLRVVSLSKPVHFNDIEGKDLVVPSGAYRVTAEENSLLLVGLEDGQTFNLAATKEEHGETVSVPMAVSTTGSEDQPDVHYVAYLSVDGEQLVAEGSYSGVRSRGFLSNAAKKAKGKVIKGAVLAKQTAQTAVANLKDKTDDVVGVVKGALSKSDLQVLINAISQLELQGLVACLSDARGTRHGEIGVLAKQMADDPAEMFQSISSDIEESVNARFSEFNRVIDAKAGNLTPANLVDASFDMLRSIGHDRPAVGCLMKILEPRIPKLKRTIEKMHATVEAKIQRTLDEKVIPVLMNKISDQIANAALGQSEAGRVVSRGAAGGLLANTPALYYMNKGEREGMATGLYAQSMARQQGIATKEINDALGKANPDPEAVRLAVVRAAKWSDEAALRYAIEVVRFRLHMEIDNDERPIGKTIKKAEDSLDMSREMSGKITSAVCGLVPEAGAAACAAIQTPLYFTWKLILKDLIVRKIKGVVHGAFDLGVDKLEEGMIAGRNSLDARHGGPFFPALRALSREQILKAAERDLPGGFKDSFDNYNTALYKVIDQWKKDKK